MQGYIIPIYWLVLIKPSGVEFSWLNHICPLILLEIQTNPSSENLFWVFSVDIDYYHIVAFVAPSFMAVNRPSQPNLPFMQLNELEFGGDHHHHLERFSAWTPAPFIFYGFIYQHSFLFLLLAPKIAPPNMVVFKFLLVQEILGQTHLSILNFTSWDRLLGTCFTNFYQIMGIF